MEDKNIEKDLVEATLCWKILDLEIQRKKECLAAVNVELQLHLKIRELCEKSEQLELDKKNCEMKQLEREAESENMEDVINSRIKELKKQLEGYRVTREQEKKEERFAKNGQMLDTLNTVINWVQKERQEPASESQDTLGHLYIMGACEREIVEAPIVLEARLHQDTPVVPQGLVDSKKKEQLVEEKHERESVEETMQELRGRINELEETLAASGSDREQMETTLLKQINEYEETLAASKSDREQMETTLHGRINKLQETLAASENDMEKMETTHPDRINELEEMLAATKSDREQMETTLRGRINKLQETQALSENDTEKMETTLCGRINELEETLAASEVEEQMETTLRGFITEHEENWKKKLGRWSNWCTSYLSI